MPSIMLIAIPLSATVTTSELSNTLTSPVIDKIGKQHVCIAVVTPEEGMTQVRS